jgi:carbon-monoxide dehydrogenase medium subunit
MFAPQFGYHRAGSAADAVALLKQHAGSKLLAGGHSLIPMLKLRLASPSAVIDIGRIPDLKGITLTGGTLRIGALTTHAEIARSGDVTRSATALSEAAIRRCATAAPSAATSRTPIRRPISPRC